MFNVQRPVLLYGIYLLPQYLHDDNVVGDNLFELKGKQETRIKLKEKKILGFLQFLEIVTMQRATIVYYCIRFTLSDGFRTLGQTVLILIRLHMGRKKNLVRIFSTRFTDL